MSFVIRGAAVGFVLSFVIVEFAHAGLLRNSGRGRLSRQFDQFVLYFGENDLNANGWISAASNDPGVFESLDSTRGIGRSVPQAGLAVSAVPSGCVGEVFDFQIQDELDRLDNELNNNADAYTDAEYEALLEEFDMIINGGIPTSLQGEPCVWEFDEGENLFAFGAFSLFFDTNEVDYEVNWSISGNGFSATLPGEINEEEFTVDGELVRKGWITLNEPSPAGLLAGADSFLNYSISASVALRPGSGGFFYTLDDPEQDEVVIEKVCEDTGNTLGDGSPEYLCGFDSVIRDLYFSPLDYTPADGFGGFFNSEPELLRIFPGSTEPGEDPTAVPSPSTLVTFLAGLMALAARRRLRASRVPVGLLG